MYTFNAPATTETTYIILGIIAIAYTVVAAAATGIIAEEKGYTSPSWLVYGLCFSVIALLHIAALPINQEELEKRQLKKGQKKRCPYCAELIKPGAIVCRFCGRDQDPEIESETPIPASNVYDLDTFGQVEPEIESKCLFQPPSLLFSKLYLGTKKMHGKSR